MYAAADFDRALERRFGGVKMNGNNNCGMLLIEGNATEDAYLRRDWTPSIMSNNISLLSTSGRTCSIPLINQLPDTSKITAMHPIRQLLQTPMINHIEVGGGAPRVACAMAELRNDTPVQVLLVNEADATQALVQVCKKKNIDQVSMGFIHTPVSIVANRLSNRLIIKERIRRHRKAPHEKLLLGDISHAVETAVAVAVVSPKAPSLASVIFSSSNGARKYFQPTGSLTRKMTLILAHQATDLICNFAELLSFTTSANIVVHDLPEDDTAAPLTVAYLLRQLRPKGLAGTVSAVVTLGRRGAVAADWLKGEHIYSLMFRPLNNSAVVPTPAGTGDWLLGAMIFFNHTWASLGLLKDPVMATTSRAMHFVCSKLGLRRDSYEISVAML
jgi:hypothetical protein